MIRKWILYPLAGLGGLLALWLVYIWVVPEPTDRLPRTLEPGSADAAALMETASTHLGAPILEGNRVELLENGDEIFPAMLAAIDSAQRSIRFLTYVYWTGDIARRFADALSAAARRGVEVRVLLDAFGAERMREELVAQLEDAGCRVAWFHPLRWYQVRQWNNRTHRKVLVVDGEVGFTGGVGIAEEWTGDAQDAEHWRDDHFRLRGPIVGALSGAFADNWTAATGEVLTSREGTPERAPREGTPERAPREGAPEQAPREGARGQARSAEAVGRVARDDARIVPLFTSPRSDMSPIGFLYWLGLRTARASVDISTPYFVPDPLLTEEIAAAAERGVRVRLLVPGERNDSWLARYASFTRYGRLLRAGVEIYEFEPTMLHVKTVLVDDRFSIVGSSNFDNRSFELNDEIALLVDSAPLNAAIRTSFANDLERARRVTRESHRSRGLWTRIQSRVAILFREQI